MLYGNIFNELNKAYFSAIRRSEISRLQLFEEFAAFYNNDYESICRYLKRDTLNNPFSLQTLQLIKFRHVNIIHKIINRLTSGVFTKDPLISFENAPQTQQLKLNRILNSCRFIHKIKDAFRKAVYFNIIEAHPVWDSQLNRLRIDIITPENYTVETYNDFLEKKKIAVRKCTPEGEIYWAVWNKTQHYIIKGSSAIPLPGNPDMKNPFYGFTDDNLALPFAALRICEGNDYFGEPNWNIFLHQKNLDIRLTDLNETELKTLHQIYLGINTNFSADETFRAGDFKQINNVKADEAEPKILSIFSNLNYESIKSNIDWNNQLVLNSEGIPPASAGTELKAVSAAAKAIDELELIEKREEYKSALYHFIINLLEITRVVWNYYNPDNCLDTNSDFNLKFSDYKSFESIDDKIKRYELAVKYGYMDYADIASEELEISRDDAVKLIKNKIDFKNFYKT